MSELRRAWEAGTGPYAGRAGQGRAPGGRRSLSFRAKWRLGMLGVNLVLGLLLWALKAS